MHITYNIMRNYYDVINQYKNMMTRLFLVSFMFSKFYFSSATCSPSAESSLQQLIDSNYKDSVDKSPWMGISVAVFTPDCGESYFNYGFQKPIISESIRGYNILSEFDDQSIYRRISGIFANQETFESYRPYPAIHSGPSYASG